METGGEAVGSGSSFCHFWFGFGSLPVELVHYKPQLRGRGETLNLTPRLAPSTLSLFPTLLHLFSSSHSIFLAPPPCPLPPSLSSYILYISLTLFAFHDLHFSPSSFCF